MDVDNAWTDADREARARSWEARDDAMRAERVRRGEPEWTEAERVAALRRLAAEDGLLGGQPGYLRARASDTWLATASAIWRRSR